MTCEVELESSLAGNDSLAFDVDERRGGAEIDREIVRKQAVEPVEDHRIVLKLLPDQCLNGIAGECGSYHQQNEAAKKRQRRLSRRLRSVSRNWGLGRRAP
jgi:hypothetical protein